ncbi:DNA sulfur modification protein DndD [Shewanella sp. 1_MG-2023]|uniref:DNA sulfur modification protein DndD n=1 Tax=unclassified Shewanella TaxID=196818 RepID=UPI0026E26717|nr:MULTISPECIES: DNA sulfur modification protein DndD [unclassified Shewanella]MDO6610516.1 DNA sulfur modification protein DndD [Shewanella sp. 7_MG-2023]MDO6770641.1 DNA sulfur modification protein DndD [Shewanella sp. 2_MG-2023]MDO6795027.1 DNA sulfur modification protein DndD [Shewanella sp. 1_MG-2023]
MIIKSLVVNNYRVFRGVHEIDLAPRVTRQHQASASPIILFGGLNGAGKTSILSAVRVALYGRAAFGRGMNSAQYQEQLDALIHNGVGITADKASIQLIFTHSQNGIESEYLVTRGWKRGQKDKLVLEQDNSELSSMSYEQCQSFLNELIPPGISDLFFFDGEKIADLAEDESGEVLQTAVRRLLGIDVAERLRSDLAIYLKRHDAAAMPDNIKMQIEKLESERVAAERAAVDLTNKAALCRAKIELIAKDIEKTELDLSSRGGAWAQSREQEKTKQLELDAERKELEKTLRAEIEGHLPFALAPNAMQALLNQLEVEKKAKQADSFNSELKGFLTELEQKLSFSLSNSFVALETIKECLNERESQQIKTDIQLDLADREYDQIKAQINNQAPSSYKRFDEARKRLTIVEEQLDSISINIARAPDQDQLEEQLDVLKALNSQRTTAIVEHRDTTEAAKKKYREAIDFARKVQKLHDKHKVATTAEASVTNAQNTHALLADFSEQLTAVRVKQLEAEFIKSYQKLARKEDLQMSARINTNTFDVELIDENKQVVNRKGLSAGEKQIYAISILEALGKTSGKKLPIIIDTPLGRLDSKHRDKLIEHYFPEASHQVIILSTDTEIDEAYFGSNYLKGDISHAFEIQFDGTTKSSSLKEGYFWEQHSMNSKAHKDTVVGAN